MKSTSRSLPRIFAVIALFAVAATQVIWPIQSASAGQITARSLTLQAGATDGGSEPGGVVNHFFQFTLPTGATIGSIQFQYCETAAGACTTPTGLATSSATLGSENGFTGMSINTSTAGAPYLFKAPTAVGANTIVSYQLAGVTNPSYGATTPDTNKTFFVRITTYATNNATGAPVDAGVVTASTAEPIILDGIMPESLIFCTGETVGLDIPTSTVPDCSTATNGTISFNQLFSPTDTATSRSQMAASTNAGAGYAISVNGPTLTSGTNTIAGMGVSGAGVRGTAQFGLNLKANTVLTSTPAVGLEVAPAPNATNFKGQPATGYDTVDAFKFTSGDIVANSYNGYTVGVNTAATDAQIYTVSYIANVPGSQAAGTYVTTLTYICTPTF